MVNTNPKVGWDIARWASPPMATPSAPPGGLDLLFSSRNLRQNILKNILIMSTFDRRKHFILDAYDADTYTKRMAICLRVNLSGRWFLSSFWNQNASDIKFITFLF